MKPLDISTARLNVRHLNLDDADFILTLLNERGWLENIGDKSIHSQADAARYLEDGPLQAYRTYGFGLFAVTLKTGVPIGLCGLIKREGLDDVDLGFAFLESFQRQGLAGEAAQAVLGYATEVLALRKMAAITLPDNRSSINLLLKLGFTCQRLIKLPNDDDELEFYQLQLPSAEVSKTAPVGWG